MTSDSQACAVQFLDERVAEDRDVLADLRADRGVEFIDMRTRQLENLRKLLPAPNGALLDEPHRWAYYPWRRVVVGLVGPKAFRTLRLDRNRNKITTIEQERLGALTIGVVGLSVGHSIAHTLALEGICGELRLADFDEIELTNLNRIPCTLMDLGVNKAIVAARRIAELDPYLHVKVFTTGFTAAVADEFMDGLDLVIEEADSLETKVAVREAARERTIPLIMETSDRGMLDLERYDLEQTRPIFHGLLEDLDLTGLADLTMQERFPYLLKFLEADQLSPRLIASRGEIGRTLSTWPQLGSDVQLGGATVAAAVRRIGLRDPLASGRIRIDVEDMLNRIQEPGERAFPDEALKSTARKNLELLVTDVAARLMGVDATTMVSITEGILADLRTFFGVDHTCLRYNDHDIRATILVAECPAREDIPDPDPLGVIYYADADEVFAQGEFATEPAVGRPGRGTQGYQDRVREGAGVPEASFLASPLVSGGVSTGFISLTRFGDRVWDADEINAMKAIAALFAQLKMRIEAEEQLRHIAGHDDLTGLSNRRALIDHLAKRLEPGMPGPVAILFVDLDRLKALNDFLGHSAGDQFIQALAKRLRDQTDPRDMIARLGGDEFVIVPAVPLTTEGAEKEAHRIQGLISERVVLGGERVSRSVSVGVAVGTPGEMAVTDVLRQADQAVLVAKAAGGNAIVVFTDEMRSQYALRDDIELHLRHAMESESLLLHFQPEVDLRTGRILAVEALVRWEHPTRGLLQPGMFIEVAEATNLAGELGRWVIRSACEQFASWRSRGLATDIVMRINVSPVQLVSLDFVGTVSDVLLEFGLDGHSLCLEITEHVVVQDLTRTRVTLEGLNRIGVQVAIDDFGTGYSSLSHLKALKVDALKIDRGFVTRLGEDSNDLAIVKSIVGLASSFGLDLVAEGVETEIAARTLLELDCYRAQGFLISRPVPPSEIEVLLSKGFVELDFASTT